MCTICSVEKKICQWAKLIFTFKIKKSLKYQTKQNNLSFYYKQWM